MNPKKLSETTVPGTTNQKTLEKRYDSWAENAHATMKWGYVAHESAAQKLWHHFSDSTVPILCFGGSSDSVMQALVDKDFRQVKTLTDTQELTAIKDDMYDAIVSVGTFNADTPEPSTFAELARITKPDGLLVLTLPTACEEGQIILDAVNHHWAFVESFGELHLKEGDMKSKMYIYKNSKAQ